MTCVVDMCFKGEINEKQRSETPVYVYENLAFSGAEDQDLVSAKARSPFLYQSNTTLNIEWFGSKDDAEDDSSWPILCFVPGVCESAETWTVQHLAVACRDHRWRLCVLELEGHGLSSGKRSVCGDFDRLVQQVEAFVRHVLSIQNKEGLPFALCGASLGGALAAYAANNMSKSMKEEETLFQGFLGAVLICPAVGVAPEAIPPYPIVFSLRLLSMVAPSAGIMTPVEDPTHYACPPTSTRNFCGHWPLATSKMLLDLTSTKVREDQAGNGRLTMETIPSLLVLAGEKDHMIPLQLVQEFVDNSKLEDKLMVAIPKADHGLMVSPKTAKIGTQKLFDWLNDRVQR
jgi:alpha-beta hydrolase superfamily lysophospholipase